MELDKQFVIDEIKKQGESARVQDRRAQLIRKRPVPAKGITVQDRFPPNPVAHDAMFWLIAGWADQAAQHRKPLRPDDAFDTNRHRVHFRSAPPPEVLTLILERVTTSAPLLPIARSRCCLRRLGRKDHRVRLGRHEPLLIFGVVVDLAMNLREIKPAVQLYVALVPEAVQADELNIVVELLVGSHRQPAQSLMPQTTEPLVRDPRRKRSSAVRARTHLARNRRVPNKRLRVRPRGASQAAKPLPAVSSARTPDGNPRNVSRPLPMLQIKRF